MVFNSITYMIFLSICFIVYYIIPDKQRWCVLLLFSCFFYSNWNAAYLLLILFVAVISYLVGIYIGHVNNRIILFGSVGIIFLCLFIFKYYNFASDNINRLLEYINAGFSLPKSNLLLPVGISFYTFQAGSYVIDVYHKKIIAERNFFKYALYIMFFPQLVAGPIERAEIFLPQIEKKHEAVYKNMRLGLQQILLGMFKKVVMADTLAIFVDGVYESVTDYNGCTLFVTALLFSIQIYGDFSGYSDIALGSARLFGYELSSNFRQPYFAASIKDFWSRWHMTLTRWFRDYIYIPLGGGRAGLLKKCRNITVVFLLSGVWHGSAWTYIVWGGVHALFRVLEEIGQSVLGAKRKHASGLIRFSKIIITFILVSVLWVIFRAVYLKDAVYVISHMFLNWDVEKMWQELQTILFAKTFSSRTLWSYMKLVAAFSVFVVFLFDVINERKNRLLFDKFKLVPRWGLYFLMAIVIVFNWFLLNGIYGQTGTFIYFQF